MSPGSWRIVGHMSAEALCGSHKQFLCLFPKYAAWSEKNLTARGPRKRQKEVPRTPPLRQHLGRKVSIQVPVHLMGRKIIEPHPKQKFKWLCGPIILGSTLPKTTLDDHWPLENCFPSSKAYCFPFAFCKKYAGTQAFAVVKVPPFPVAQKTPRHSEHKGAGKVCSQKCCSLVVLALAKPPTNRVAMHTGSLKEAL